jgi:hypothetical protein
MACFSPSTSTLIRAINNGNFATWPMFTSENIKKHLPKSEATALGHLDQQRKNTQSTKRTPTTRATTTTANTTESKHGRTHNTYAALLNINLPTGQIHLDRTGHFPNQSSRGNKYVMILYDYNINAILAEAMSSCTAHEMIRAYEKLHTYLVTRGLKPQLQGLDNEASQKLKDFMRSKNIDYQLAPSHCHRRNSAERAIQTWKKSLHRGTSQHQ